MTLPPVTVPQLLTYRWSRGIPAPDTTEAFDRQCRTAVARIRAAESGDPSAIREVCAAHISTLQL